MLKMVFKVWIIAIGGGRAILIPTLLLPSQYILLDQKFKCKNTTVIILEILENKILMVKIKIVDGPNNRMKG